MMFVDCYMLYSDKNSGQIVFLYLLETSEDFSYLPGNLGRTVWEFQHACVVRNK